LPTSVFEIMKPIFIYTTTKTKSEAEKIARVLLKAKLIACANFFPIGSLYLWKGKIEKTNECGLLLKTFANKFEGVKNSIKKNSSYEIPCIAKIPIESYKNYLNWMQDEIS